MGCQVDEFGYLSYGPDKGKILYRVVVPPAA